MTTSKMISEIVEVQDKYLTQWEIGFMDNIKKWKPDKLRPKQLETLEKIYKKVCRGYSDTRRIY